MYAVIDTKGANRICIHIPHQGSDKSLPQLAAVLENNAVFINEGWSETTIVKPEMKIILGDTFSTDQDKPAITIASNGAVLTEDFVIDSPEVRVSFKKVLEDKDKRITTLETELKYLKSQLQQAQDLLAAKKEEMQ